MQLSRALVLVLLVGACGGGGGEGDGAGDPDAAGPVDAPADGATVPLIGEALADMCGAYTPGSGVGAGNDLHKVTLTNPDAVCNDGTRAVMYVRPSSGGVNSGRWVVYLQGGSNCGGFGDCAIRYCGTDFYTKAKMSTRWTPMVANTDDQGLLDRDGVNPFGEANAVLLYYCSSDNWTGTRSDTVLTNPTDPTQQYRIHFRGHTIVQAAFDQLRAGPVTSDDGAVTMPDLDGAASLLFAGTSAGAAGVENNVDELQAQLATNGTIVRAVFDANLPPDSRDLDPALASALDAQFRDVRWPQTMVGAWGIAADRSCLAAHPGDDQWLCGDLNHLVMNHVTTPFIARQDLRDPTIGKRYTNAGAPTGALAGWWRTSLLRVPDLRQTAEERAQITVRPGIYAPNCAQHVALTTKAYFEQATITPSGGSALTWRGAILAWLAGDEVTAIDTQPASLSSCPPPAASGE